MAVWIDPVSPRRITARFGQSGPNWTNKHTGLDFDGQTGDKVVAVADGRVTFAGWRNSSYGNMVIVAHNAEVETWYAHLSAVTRMPGMTVKQGGQVGKMGATGNVTGSHTHLEVRVNGAPMDPEQFLGKDLPDDIGTVDSVSSSGGLFNLPDLAGGFKQIGLFVGGVVVLLLGGYLLYQNRSKL